ncbi:hypothetical protein KR044_002336, partial [Drosophila immigrans]
MLHISNRQPHLEQHATHGSGIYEQESESQLNFSSFEELCRLCAIHRGAAKLHIFEPQAKQRQLLHMLRTLLQANISKDDCLPQRVCELCLQRVEHLYEWRQRCMRNEQLLRNYAASMHTVRATIDFQVSATWRGLR